MTTEEFNKLRPKPWSWRRTKTTFTLEDANGVGIGVLLLLRNQRHTNHHEWMRHVGAAMADLTTITGMYHVEEAE